MTKNTENEPKTLKEKIRASTAAKKTTQEIAESIGEPLPETVTKNPNKPHSLYTKEMGEQICLLVGEGKQSLSTICEGFGISRMTFYRWMQENEALLHCYTSARQNQADSMDDNMALVVEDMMLGKVDPHKAKVAVGVYQWRAERLKPRVYGALSQVDPDKQASASAIGRMSTEELQALRSRLISAPITIIEAETVSDNVKP